MAQGPDRLSSSDVDWSALRAAAQDVGERAYVPYSGLKVGAAALTDRGAVVAGCNVENASYGLSLCAERNAVAAARVQGLLNPGSSEIVAVAIHTPDGSMPWPCGACRQVMREFSSNDVPVLVDGPQGVVESTIGELLPRAFVLRDR